MPNLNGLYIFGDFMSGYVLPFSKIYFLILMKLQIKTRWLTLCFVDAQAPDVSQRERHQWRMAVQ